MNSKIKMNAAIFSLVAGFVIFLGKITAFLLTGSSAIFSDAAESVVHIIATSMVVFSIYLSNKPPDKNHFYGHGNVEYFSAGIEGFLIIIAALTIIYFAVHDLILGPSPENLDIGTLIIGIAGVVNLFVGYYLVNQGKKTNSVALIADGKHILTDSFTSLGVVFGLVLILITGILIIDPIIAIIVALNIVYTGYKLIRESVGSLMNETDPVLLGKIVEYVSNIKKPYWIDLHHLRFWKSANSIFIDFHLTLPYYFTIKESHLEEEYAVQNMNNKMENVEIRVHFDFCTYELCPKCEHSSCKDRQEEYVEKIEWSVTKLTGDPLNKKVHIS